MRAIIYSRWGSPDVLTLADIHPPPLAPDAVRIAVEWSAVNPLEWKVLSGMYKLLCRGGWPRRIGAEGSGRVVAVGARVKELKAGMRVVFGLTPMDGRFGGWAEQTDAPASRVMAVPEGVDLRDAATLPIAALTAWLMCRMTHVGTGKSVLVTGASGGVGSFAVQIAKSLGAQVTATGSERNRSAIMQLGADEFFDYRSSPIEKSGRRWDAIVDCVNSLPRPLSRGLLTERGRYVDTDPRPLTMLRDLLRTALGSRAWQTVAVNMQKEGMHALFDLLRAGKLKPLIARELSLDQAPDALRDVLSGHAVGKSILKIRPS